MEASCMVGLYKRDQATTYEKDEKMMMMMMMKMERHQDGDDHHHGHDDDDDNDAYISESSTSSSFDGSNMSKESSSSDLLDDDASSSSSSSSSNNGPLYELSELMNQLPIKRGLSKYYQGKSQSFTSLARVTSLEDLAKKESPYQRKLKACRSYGGGLSNFRSYTRPKATISKKAAKSSMSNLSCLSRKGSFVMGSPKPPLSPVKIN